MAFCRFCVWLLVSLAVSVGAAQKPVVVSGSIPNPTGKSGTVVAWAGYFDMSPTGVIAYGEVLPSGAFSFELPKQVRGDVLHPVEAKNVCQSGGQAMTVNPSGTTHMLVNTLLAFDMTKDKVTAILASSDDLVARVSADKRDVRDGDALGYYLYAERPLTMKGNCVSADGIAVEYDVRASAGWNLLTYTFGTSTAGEVTGRIATVRAFPNGLAWVPTGR